MSDETAEPVDVASEEVEPVDLATDEAEPGWFGVYLRGVAMGAADAVPGVSGGTVALITGIYDRLVAAISALDPRDLGDALADPGGGRLGALRDALVGMDVPFLLVLGLGIATGLVSLAQVLEWALGAVRLLTFAFFFGLILASAAVLYGEVALDTRGRKAVAAAGLLAGFLLVGDLRAAIGHDPGAIFVAGMIGVSAMLLPGVSGSFLLLVLGQYEYMVARLNGALEGLAGLATGGPANPDGDLLVVGVFLGGAAVGLLSVAHVIDYALERNRAATLTFLVSLMVGALRLPAAEVVAGAGGAPGSYAAGLVAAVAGAALVVLVERTTGEIGFE